MTEKQALIVAAQIETQILLIRVQKVMLSVHLAALYEVEPRVLIQAVKRNIERFPEDFMFQLKAEEFANLKSQIVISSWGGARTAPYAFTEQGVAMLSSVLRSSRAIQGQYRHHAHLRTATADAILQRRTVAQAGRAGKELRHQIQSNI